MATDTGADCLPSARAGVFCRSSLKQLPDRLREQYFCPQRGGRQYLIRLHRLPAIRWQQHDLLGPSFEDGRVHLVLLRNNLLTYYHGPDRLAVHTDRLDRDHGCPWIYRYETSPREK